MFRFFCVSVCDTLETVFPFEMFLVIRPAALYVGGSAENQDCF